MPRFGHVWLLFASLLAALPGVAHYSSGLPDGGAGSDGAPEDALTSAARHWGDGARHRWSRAGAVFIHDFKVSAAGAAVATRHDEAVALHPTSTEDLRGASSAAASPAALPYRPLRYASRLTPRERQQRQRAAAMPDAHDRSDAAKEEDAEEERVWAAGSDGADGRSALVREGWADVEARLTFTTLSQSVHRPLLAESLPLSITETLATTNWKHCHFTYRGSLFNNRLCVRYKVLRKLCVAFDWVDGAWVSAGLCGGPTPSVTYETLKGARRNFTPPTVALSESLLIEARSAADPFLTVSAQDPLVAGVSVVVPVSFTVSGCLLAIWAALCCSEECFGIGADARGTQQHQGRNTRPATYNVDKPCEGDDAALVPPPLYRRREKRSGSNPLLYQGAKQSGPAP